MLWAMPTPEHDALQGELASVLHAARSDIAAGREPDPQALETRLRAAGGGAAELEQLRRVLTVHRARARLAAPPVPPPAAAPVPLRRRATFRAQPTITGNMEVRRARSERGVVLSWDTAAGVAGWEIRVSEREDARSEYVVRTTSSLPAGATSLELTLRELPQRVHVLGRSADGRLVRRAIVSALTKDNWSDRWQRRASAS